MLTSIQTSMAFHLRKSPDGLYHVQNMVGVLEGQHHVHTKRGYEAWMNGAPVVVKEDIIELAAGPCDCGLSAGDVREYTGSVWNNPKWAT